MLSYTMKPEDKIVIITFLNDDGVKETLSTPILPSLNKTILGPQKISGRKEEVLYAINKYLAQIPISVQKKIYEEIKFIYDNIILYPGDLDIESASCMVHDSLNRLISNRYLSMENIQAWCKSNINVPDTIDVKFDPKRGIGHTQQQTYIVSEYIELTALAVVVKLFFPILYMLQKFGSDISNNGNLGKGKDTYLIQKICYTVLPEVVRQSPGFTRLETFVIKSTNNSSITAGKILKDGMSTESKVTYVVSYLVINKLTLVTLCNASGHKNLASHLYSSIVQLFRVNPRTEVKSKIFSINGSSEYSLTDLYKDSEKYAVHDNVTMLHVAKIENLIRLYKPFIKIGRVKEQYRILTNTAMPVVHNKLQAELASNILRMAVAPDTFKIIDSKAFRGCCAIASDLIREEHKLLSLLLLCGCKMVANKNGALQPEIDYLKFTEPPRALMSKMREMYPFWNIMGKVDTANKQSKLVTNKHIMSGYIKDMETEASKVWIAYLSEENREYYSDMIKPQTDKIQKGDDTMYIVKPMPSFTTELIELFLNIDDIGEIADDAYISAINGTLTI